MNHWHISAYSMPFPQEEKSFVSLPGKKIIFHAWRVEGYKPQLGKIGAHLGEEITDNNACFPGTALYKKQILSAQLGFTHCITKKWINATYLKHFTKWCLKLLTIAFPLSFPCSFHYFAYSKFWLQSLWERYFLCLCRVASMTDLSDLNKAFEWYCKAHE